MKRIEKVILPSGRVSTIEHGSDLSILIIFLIPTSIALLAFLLSGCSSSPTINTCYIQTARNRCQTGFELRGNAFVMYSNTWESELCCTE